jgi:UDP-N-acetylglucosamine:LPS N-acetylglucosamine transferase
MSDKKKTILAVSSGGGHWIELLRLQPAFGGHHVIYATTSDNYRTDVPDKPFRIVHPANRWDKLGAVKSAFSSLWLLLALRPDVVISTGAAPGYMAIRIGGLLGAKTIWVDSIANAEEISLSGQMAGKYADHWLTQWPHLEKPEGPHYRGSVL